MGKIPSCGPTACVSSPAPLRAAILLAMTVATLASLLAGQPQTFRELTDFYGKVAVTSAGTVRQTIALEWYR
jgi:hypothetical protein